MRPRELAKGGQHHLRFPQPKTRCPSVSNPEGRMDMPRKHHASRAVIRLVATRPLLQQKRFRPALDPQFRPGIPCAQIVIAAYEIDVQLLVLMAPLVQGAQQSIRPPPTRMEKITQDNEAFAFCRRDQLGQASAILRAAISRNSNPDHAKCIRLAKVRIRNEQRLTRGPVDCSIREQLQLFAVPFDAFNRSHDQISALKKRASAPIL